MSNYRFVKCIPEDLDDVKSLLMKSNLPFEDIDSHIDNFIVVRENDAIVGVIGLEMYGSIGLLRSLAVDPSMRNKGLAKALVDKMMFYSGSIHIKELYLLTTTAEKFFEKFGFCAIERNKVPDTIKNTMEFKSICPVSAICMKREM